MARLTWEPGVRPYEAGIDRGVLYLADKSGIAWTGLISVEEEIDSEGTPYYMDGIRFLNSIVEGDFAAKLTAFTYPDEFETANVFGLSYRTQMGEDRKVHILYNLTASPSEKTFETISEDPNALEFSWSINGVPEYILGNRPTAHAILDFGWFDPTLTAALEDILYGTDTAAPRLPSISELMTFLTDWKLIVITDHGDGTWTATTAYDNIITFSDDTTFMITGIDGTFFDADTYTISTTEEP